MKEEQIRERIRAADTGPPPPTELVARTAARGAAIERGRAAEAELERIARQGSPGGDCAAPAASALVGQMAMLMPLPASAERMERQLMESPRFRKLAEQPVDKLLSDVRSGRMLKALVKAEPRNIKPAERTNEPKAEKGGIVGP